MKQVEHSNNVKVGKYFIATNNFSRYYQLDSNTESEAKNELADYAKACLTVGGQYWIHLHYKEREGYNPAIASIKVEA